MMNLETDISMKKEQSAKDQTLMTWIVVLAVAITCCAILFLVFANYLSVINKNLAAADARLTVMESNEAQLLSEIQALHRTMIAQSKSAQPAEQAPAAAPAARRLAPNAPA